MQYYIHDDVNRIASVQRGDAMGVAPRIIELPNGAQAFPVLNALASIAPSVDVSIAAMIAGMLDSTLFNDDGEPDMSPAWIEQFKVAAFLGRSFFAAFKGNPGDPDNVRPQLRTPSETDNVLVMVFRDNSGATWTDGVLLDGLDDQDGVLEFWRSTSSILPIGQRQVAPRAGWHLSSFADGAPVQPLYRVVVPEFEKEGNDHIIDAVISVHAHIARRR